MPASPGAPLFPISPERVNRQHPPALPHSPSLPSDFLSLRQDPSTSSLSKASSDVQGKVAQFNNLSKEAIQRRKDNEAALRRAVVGREEAESEARRLKEENRLLSIEIEEGRARERRVGERVEAVMEEMQRAKETHARSQTLYEKEIRRARKEAFKSSSALVKLQEDLKTARNRFTLMREEVEVQKRKVEAKEQETFAAQYQLVGVQEELEKTKQDVTLVTEENTALKTSLKEEEIARIAAEGSIALPVSAEADEFASPQREDCPTCQDLHACRRGSLKENVDPVLNKLPTFDENELTILKRKLKYEIWRRKDAEEMVEHLQIECQFKVCSCRLAERDGYEYIHDRSVLDDRYKERIAQLRVEQNGTASQYELATRASEDTLELPKGDEVDIGKAIMEESEPENNQETREDLNPQVTFSPTTGTFHTVPSPTHLIHSSNSATPSPPSPSAPTTPFQNQHLASSLDSPTDQENYHIDPPQISFPSTPRPPASSVRPQTMRVISTTTTVPLAEPYSPACTMTREEALEQIRHRRGRARSVALNGTPRKPLTGPAALRRDISAPAGTA